MTKLKKIVKLLESNKIPLLVFFGSLFILISFAGTRMFFSDEGVILNQFYNLVHGSLALTIAKINMTKGVFVLVDNNLYGKFSYSLLILSLPVYYILKLIDFFIGAHFFILQLWALSGGIIVYLATKSLKLKHTPLSGMAAYFILAVTSLYFFKPIYFPVWGELLSIEFVNILIASFSVLIIYLLFKSFFGNKIAIFASFFVLFATPISFYAITLKHHMLAVFLTVLAFYLFYKYQDKKNDKYIYSAYALAGLCVWTRILDGTVLLASLLIVDIFIFKRSIKYLLSISVVILISLMPFFIFNYLILGSPFSVMETYPLSNKAVMLVNDKNIIPLNVNPVYVKKQLELLDNLGYSWNPEVRTDWVNILFDITFLKLGNTLGIFLVSPFLITALAFAVYRAKWKIKLNTVDKFLGIYTILFVLSLKDYIPSIVTDTPVVLEYRYLLIIYLIMLYFALRINKVRDLIECNFKEIAQLYCSILLIFLIYFILEFPAPFMNIYYFIALITSISLIITVLINLLTTNKKPGVLLLDKSITFIIALSLAEASILLLFYYWVSNMIYISPSQNYTIVPFMENMIKWMYQIIL